MMHTPGPWMVATSCSWRRILTERGEPVIVPTTHRVDGHPDLNATMADLNMAALSPRLLQALEAAMAFIDAEPATIAEMKAWRHLMELKPKDLIAEAKGETP